MDYSYQAVLIFLSVFMAFWLTEYRESRNHEQALKVSLRAIAEELSVNHKRVEETYRYHNRLRSQIDSVNNLPGNHLNQMYGYQLPGWQGVRLAGLRSTANQTFIRTGISDMEKFTLSKALADIYEVQKVVEKLENSFYEKALSDKGFTSLDKMHHMASLYMELLPDVMFMYQKIGRKYLEPYGYTLEIKEKLLEEKIKSRNH